MGCASIQQQTGTGTHGPERILCFGDSITELGHWTETVGETPNYDMINAGRAGRKTSDISRELPPVLAANPDFDHILFFLGVNDLPARDPRPGPEKIADCTANMKTAINMALQQVSPEQITLIAPTGVCTQGLNSVNLQKGYDITPPLLEELEVAYRQLAFDTGVRFLSLRELLVPADYKDGLHPNEQGDAKIAAAIQRHLDERGLPSVFVIGDSISIDYHNGLMQLSAGHYAYARKGGLAKALENLDHPQGANGGNSHDVLNFLDKALVDGTIRADFVLLNCGLHDIKRDPKTSQIEVPIEEYQQNLQSIIRRVRDAGKQLIWISTTPVDEKRHQARQPYFHRYEADLSAFNEAAARIMAKNHVPVIDLYSFTSTIQDPYRDHVHFRRDVIAQQAAFIHGWLTRNVQ